MLLVISSWPTFKIENIFVYICLSICLQLSYIDLLQFLQVVQSVHHQNLQKYHKIYFLFQECHAKPTSMTASQLPAIVENVSMVTTAFPAIAILGTLAECARHRSTNASPTPASLEVSVLLLRTAWQLHAAIFGDNELKLPYAAQQIKRNQFGGKNVR